MQSASQRHSQQWFAEARVSAAAETTQTATTCVCVREPFGKYMQHAVQKSVNTGKTCAKECEFCTKSEEVNNRPWNHLTGSWSGKRKRYRRSLCAARLASFRYWMVNGYLPLIICSTAISDSLLKTVLQLTSFKCVSWAPTRLNRMNEFFHRWCQSLGFVWLNGLNGSMSEIYTATYSPLSKWRRRK